MCVGSVCGNRPVPSAQFEFPLLDYSLLLVTCCEEVSPAVAQVKVPVKQVTRWFYELYFSASVSQWSGCGALLRLASGGTNKPRKFDRRWELCRCLSIPAGTPRTGNLPPGPLALPADLEDKVRQIWKYSGNREWWGYWAVEGEQWQWVWRSQGVQAIIFKSKWAQSGPFQSSQATNFRGNPDQIQHPDVWTCSLSYL